MQEVNSHKRAGSKMRDILETDKYTEIEKKKKKKAKQSKIGKKKRRKEHINWQISNIYLYLILLILQSMRF
jgi:predicted nucleic acid-binding protein